MLLCPQTYKCGSLLSYFAIVVHSAFFMFSGTGCYINVIFDLTGLSTALMSPVCVTGMYST